MMQQFLMRVVLSCLLILRSKSLIGGTGVPEGWRMEDRFIGFRYELASPFDMDGDVKNAIRGEKILCLPINVVVLLALV